MSARSHTGKRDFLSLRAELLRTRSYFVDPDFPPEAKSLTFKGDQPFRNFRIKWLRPIDIAKNPKFITKGATRFDLTQGSLGNCWFVAGAALLAFKHRNYFVQVVPDDQSFDEDYAGIFHFKFWWYGRWKEVIIDDFLPTDGYRLVYGRNMSQPDEFWTALLEKAYAKLHGCYQSLEGGKIQDALVDLTGGISETVNLEDKSKIPPNLFDLLWTSFHMQSMMGGSINRPEDATESEVLQNNGLYAGHAYSITGMAVVPHAGKEVPLMRLRNPWGRGEWNGAWSDKSYQMTGLTTEEKQKLKLIVQDDGEFWISFEDLIRSFDEIQLCHIQPDAHTQEIAGDEGKDQWNVMVFHDAWTRGLTAGGCGNSPYQKQYWQNPQFQVTLKEKEDDRGGNCTLIVDLMEKEEYNRSSIAIGFDIYKIRNSRHRPLSPSDTYSRHDLVRQSQSGKYQFYREVCRRYELPVGNYVIIPSTFEPNEEADFLLRLFTVKKVETVVLDEIDVPSSPEPLITDVVTDLFNKNCGRDGKVDVKELRTFLSELAKIELSVELDISKESCRSLLTMKDKNKSGFIDLFEAKELWEDVKSFTSVFRQFDADGTGSVDTFELGKMFRKLGFPISRGVLTSIVRRYGGRNNEITLDDFVIAMSKLVLMFHIFSDQKKRSESTDDSASFTRNEFLQYSLMC